MLWLKFFFTKIGVLYSTYCYLVRNNGQNSGFDKFFSPKNRRKCWSYNMGPCTKIMFYKIRVWTKASEGFEQVLIV
jgi:hypothetical protein